MITQLTSIASYQDDNEQHIVFSSDSFLTEQTGFADITCVDGLVENIASSAPVQLLDKGTHITVKIVGEIHSQQQALLNDVLFRALKKQLPVNIDLSELSYFDLDNMQLIFSAQKEAKRAHIPFVLEPLSHYAKHTIRLSGLSYELFRAKEA